MTTRCVALGCLLAVLMVPAAARADTERYFVGEQYRPEGVTFGFSIQAGGFVSSSCCEIGGRRGAGGGGIRIGTVATSRMLWSLQLEGATVPVKVEGGTEFNRHGTFTLGLQYFVRDTLWVRGGIGFATYEIEKETVESDTLVADLQRSGFAFASTVGFDFFRSSDAWSFGLPRQDLALSYEINVASAIYPGGKPEIGDQKQKWGLIMQLTMGLGLQWY